MTVQNLINRYKKGTISLSMLKVYVRKGIITEEQFKEITGVEYK